MFQLNHKAEIRAINVSKGKDEESPVIATISLDFDSVGREPVAAAFGCEESDLDGLFTDSGESRFTGITDITSWAKFEDKHSLQMLNFHEDVSKVSAIKVTPRSATSFKLSCNIQIQDPHEHVVETIVAALHDAVTVKLDQEAELPLERPGDEREAA